MTFSYNMCPFDIWQDECNETVNVNALLFLTENDNKEETND